MAKWVYGAFTHFRSSKPIRTGAGPFHYDLKGCIDLIQQHLMARRGHFMPPDLLASQFDTLEEPEDVLTVDIAQSPDRIVHDIRRAFA